MRRKVTVQMLLDVDADVGLDCIESNLIDAASYHGGKFQGLITVLNCDVKKEEE